MEPEDGVIWVYGLLADDAVMAFTDDGIDEVKTLLEMHRENTKASPRT